MQIAFFRSARGFFAAGRAIDISASGRKCFENRIEVLHNFIFAADHLAVAALQSPHAAAGADVHVVQTFRGQFLGTADVINVVGISAVDKDVAAFELGYKSCKSGVDDACRHHQPDSARLA